MLLPRLVSELYWDSDAASAFVLAERLRGAGPVFIPHFGWWSSLWWLLATRHLPDHVQLWEVTGYAFALAGAALVGWATGRLAGRWAGMTASAVAVVVGPLALRALLTVNYHVSTPFTATVLAADLVLLVGRRSRALAAGVGLVAGVNAASDPLLWVAGIGPFAIAAAVLAATARRRDVGALAGLTLVVTVVSALATDLLMRSLDFHIISTDLRPAHVGDLVPNFLKLGKEVALLGGANYILPGGYPREPVRIVVGLLALAGVAAALYSAVRAIACRSEPTMLAYACYWAAAPLLLGITFVTTSQGTAVAGGGFLYLLTLAPAAGAGVGLLAAGSRRGESAAALAVALVGAVNIAGLAHGRAGTPAGAIGSYKQPLVQLLEQKGVTRGYAGYWDAASLTWQSGNRLLIAPVGQCGAELCRFRFFTISSWYEERPGPSFLIVDPDTAFVTTPPVVTRDAVESHRFGPLTVYLFPCDLARHIRR